jgi:hypothetical protein
MDKADEETFEATDIRHYLAEYHDLQRIEMEIAQPGRLAEVLAEMERRGFVESTGEGAWRLVANEGVGA